MIFYADYSHIISLEVLIGLVCEKSKWIEDLSIVHSLITQLSYGWFTEF